eukprot:NODE_4793_length_740_cov_15.703100_g4631_i0.p1 GENE.NODE_4793_length_740_cov_15.703100_g4631_i0~~NODE_4793_length_740_cov_15.703100_g4631_i0.p1  ORF type:complete len:234 (+),score=60.27 NODE_4793_length_740_cov_15.703100_g4631_i0:2-703(+)
MGGPLHELTFHYVPDVSVVVAQLLATHTPTPTPTYSNYEGLTPTLAAALRTTLAAEEEVLWWHHPPFWRIALFSCSFTILMFTNMPWVLWAGSPWLRHYTFHLTVISVLGLCVGVAIAWLEALQCRVVYAVTTQSVNVFHVHSNTLLMFPRDQLRSVGRWVEGAHSSTGALSFVFRCDSLSAQCLATERRGVFFGTYHVKPRPEAMWRVPVQQPKHVREVLGRVSTQELAVVE